MLGSMILDDSYWVLLIHWGEKKIKAEEDQCGPTKARRLPYQLIETLTFKSQRAGKTEEQTQDFMKW